MIAAGSVLGLALADEKVSYPVGKAESLRLNPMNFEEFLWAMGEHALASHIRECYAGNQYNFLHEKALRLYQIYLVCGGMPEAVKLYRVERDLVAIQGIHRQLEAQHLADMAKYAPVTEVVKIRDTWQSLPNQLTIKNKKFQYSGIAKGVDLTGTNIRLHGLSLRV